MPPDLPPDLPRPPSNGAARRGPARLAGLAALAVVLLAAGAAAIVAATSAATSAARDDRVRSGTTVAGVPIGDLTAAEATARLEDSLGRRAGAAVDLRADGRSFALDPATAGLRFDAAATVEAARGGRALAFLRGAGDRAIVPVIKTDEARLTAALTAVGENVHRLPQDGAVRLQGTRPVVTPAVTGQELDLEAARQRVRDGYLVAPGPIELPLTTKQPRVDAARLDRVVREVVTPAVAAPVILAIGDDRLSVPPRLLAPTLRFGADDGGVVRATVDGAALRAALLRRGETLERPPTGAGWRVANGKVTVVPASSGRTVSAAALAGAVEKVVTSTGERVAQVAGAPVQARRTTEQAKDLGIVEKVASFTQTHPGEPYRVHNIARAARYVDGTVLRPGEVFSMNETARERTRANGYVEGGVIKAGRLRKELGGGVSTITTAMWNAAFFAGLERVEQRAHSFHISRYRPGLEATVVFGALDLKFRNDTPNGILIKAIAKPKSVTVELYGTKRYDVQAVYGPRHNIRAFKTLHDPKPDCVPQGGTNGFDIDVTRVFREGERDVRRQVFTTRYNPADRVYCQATPGAQAPAVERPSVAG